MRTALGPTSAAALLVLVTAIGPAIGPAVAADADEGNLRSYPSSRCRAPRIPTILESAQDKLDFKQDVDAYRACVKAYTDKGRVDIETINDALRRETDEYNAYIEKIRPLFEE